MPPRYAPMLATPGPLPSGEGWWYEVKWDGARCVLAADAARAWAAHSRTGTSFNDRFPELAEIRTAGRRLVLDGEVVVLDAGGRPDFGLLQSRLHARRPRAGDPSAVMMVFDLLHLDDDPLTSRPLSERRRLLEGLGLAGPHLSVPPYWTSRQQALDFTRAHRLEGVVAKNTSAPYLAGARSMAWIKAKHTTTVPAVVVGWQANHDGSAARSLLLALPDAGGELVYAGRAGSGISAREARQLAAELAPLAAPEPAVTVPPRLAARWVTPRLVVDISHLERTASGHLRHPVFEHIRGMIDDPRH